LFQTISQFETRSNVSATEIDARRAESLVMLGPVLERIEYELLGPIVERVFAIMSRAGILPPAPSEVQGQPINVEFVSMLATSQAAAATGGIERLLQIAGGLVAVDPAVMDNIDVDYALDKYSSLMNNDPKIIRAPGELQAIRQQRAQAQAQQQAAANADTAQKMAQAGQTLSQTDVGGGQNALQKMTGVAP
ncbi:MAG TPA: portal protein, partial [Candidatus Methylomirabilis sp.]|nr:portal protein [Candidatus Methylomirabilis sp.]